MFHSKRTINIYQKHKGFNMTAYVLTENHFILLFKFHSKLNSISNFGIAILKERSVVQTISYCL